MNATVKAIRQLQEEDARVGGDLEGALGLSGLVLQFTASKPDAEVEKQADLHRAVIADLTSAIARRNRNLKATVARLREEIARLERDIVDAEAAADTATRADETLIAASQAWLERVEASGLAARVAR